MSTYVMGAFEEVYKEAPEVWLWNPKLVEEYGHEG
jgi:hypothetical protein